ncbi:MAG TPA: Cys-tRNA(Pro) deacylase [Chloroflexota bacterium]|jgi:Cys-tRNA(Pro)/Cys-tRNA(Cys) deacylase|nr:Cys-tRNA(Pro) deacylase [Chloroflexota bacterium]
MERSMKRGATPAIVAAEHAGISFSVHEYEHDPNAPSFGLEAAQALGVPVERVFKTLVALIDGTRYVVAVIPVAERLSLKALAAAAGGKKAELAQPASAERITGYVVGGISPLGQRKLLPTFLDQSALPYQTIYVSAGRRGLDIELAPGDLMRLTKAGAASLVQSS